MAGRPPAIPDTDFETVRRRYDAGESPLDIAASYGATRGAVTRLLLKFGAVMSQQGGAKPTDPAIVDAIIAAYKDGAGSTSLARLHGVSKKTVFNILNRAGVGVRPKGGGEARVTEKRKERKPRSAHGQKPVNADAFDVLDEAASYWAGFIAADGCIFATAYPGKFRLSVRQATRYEDQLLRCRAFLGSTNAITRSKHLDPSGVERETSAFAITCAKITNRLMSLGIVPRKSERMKITKELASSPHFWRGFCDGNGTVYSWKDFYIAGSKPLLTQFCDFARSVYPETNVRLVEQPGCYRTVMNAESSRRLLRALYGDAAVFMPRKRDAALGRNMDPPGLEPGTERL